MFIASEPSTKRINANRRKISLSTVIDSTVGSNGGGPMNPLNRKEFWSAGSITKETLAPVNNINQPLFPDPEHHLIDFMENQTSMHCIKDGL